MPISGKGWEFHVVRLSVQKKGGVTRTCGRYQVYINGVPVPDLSGDVFEAQGPGDNTKTGKNKRRVEAGRYQLYTQFGKYASLGYASANMPAGKTPMPGFRLENRGVRTDILVHPAHPPSLYLSSIGCLNLSEAVGPKEDMNFWDSRKRVIALLNSLQAFHPKSFSEEVIKQIPNAFAVIDGDPMNRLVQAPHLRATKVKSIAAGSAEEPPLSLPISADAARKCAAWLWQNFRPDIQSAVHGKPYSAAHLAAIVCQETAYKWVEWIGKKSVKTIVERAVYDASGDDPKSPRTAFPKNTAEFRQRFGPALTNMLIDEANQTRALQSWKPKKWVYKGYGLFQYDLQHIHADPDFFKDRQWYVFKTCLAKCTMELDRKFAKYGELWKAIRAYNGSGPRAQAYMENVRYYTPICAEIVGAAAPKVRIAAVARRGRSQPVARRTAVAFNIAADGLILSGPEWVSRFPDSGRVDVLEPDFRKCCELFIAALRNAGATVVVNSTRRPIERAYLMNGAWQISREGVDPSSLPDATGVNIKWAHPKADGSVDRVKSRKAAADMLKAYGIAYKPALKSNHITGEAIDMTISWSGALHIVNGKGKVVAIASGPRSGMNEALWAVGGSFGVKKLPKDRPHWSANGH